MVDCKPSHLFQIRISAHQFFDKCLSLSGIPPLTRVGYSIFWNIALGYNKVYFNISFLHFGYIATRKYTFTVQQLKQPWFFIVFDRKFNSILTSRAILSNLSGDETCNDVLKDWDWRQPIRANQRNVRKNFRHSQMRLDTFTGCHCESRLAVLV